MAEGVLFNTAGTILQVLGSIAVEEIGLASGVKAEISKLKDTIRSVKGVLLDAEEQHNKKNQEVAVWLGRLRDAVYDADDLLDDFTTKLLRREVMMMTGNEMAKKVRIFFSKYNQFVYGLRMGRRIKGIRERLDQIKNDRQFHLIECRDEKQIVNTEREQTHSFVRGEEVIGRDDEKNEVIGLLLDSNNTENVSVVPIVGIGGLGKTTLAQLVYNDQRVKRHFELRMWVCVSDVFDLKILVEKIITSATGKEVGRRYMDQLQDQLRDEIDGKRYLLVLDDIWNENRDKWLKLHTLLMNGGKGSRILVTTRSEEVAKITSKLPFYVLRGLPEDKAWSLFSQMALEQEVEPKSSNLVQIGKCIVVKCSGVPLAIRTIGRLLYHNTTEDYWLRFSDYELSKIEQEESDILPKLRLSYNHLPSYLKQCFAYCALFPKDYVIEKETLINLWMAQGFLQSSNKNQHPEDVGNECFMMLLSRSFFQEVEYDEWGTIIKFKMHDLMHDLASSVAGVDCTMAKLDAKNVDERTHHTSFDSKLGSSWKIPTALLKAKNIRTFLLPVHSHLGGELSDSSCRKILSSFKHLRALDLRRSMITELPNSINKLEHLRYLDLSCNFIIRKLPYSITRLRNLQTLKLINCYSLRELPRGIGKMVSLRHLMVHPLPSFIGMPCGLGLLTSLRTLSLFVLGKRRVKIAELSELNKLNNLSGRLAIEGLENATSKPLLANLDAKQHLVSLSLKWDDKNGQRLDSETQEVVLKGLKPHMNLKELSIHWFRGLVLSSWLSSLKNLMKIEIFYCTRCQYLPPLDQLPSLKSMYLYKLYSLEYISSDENCNTSSTVFPSLKKVKVVDCPNLRGWMRRDDDGGGATIQTAELPSFTCLASLTIWDCPKLTSMPLYPSLERLTLCDTSLKPLQQTLMSVTTVSPSTSSDSCSPLSKLKYLVIGNCDELDFLKSEYDKQWRGLWNLHSLKLSLVPELLSLPKGLQHVTSLQCLQISACPNLVVLPEEMQLQILEISDCPQLSERYGNEMCVDWAKIAHIPNIKVDNKWIQMGGCHQRSMEHMQ